MLVKYAGIYSLARGVPGLVNFLALALYTRLLAPADYGTYVLIIAWLGIANAVLFQWLRSGARRFQAAYQNRPETILASLAAGYLAMLAVTALIALGLLLVTQDAVLHRLIPLALALLWFQALFELGLELVLAGLNPWRYGLLALTKSLVALVVGGLLAYLGFGASGVLTGAVLGFVVPVVLMLRMEWQGIRPSFQHRESFRTLLIYGVPLSATFVLDYVINSSDRLLLGHFRGTDAVGTYAAAYDLSQQGLYALLLVIYLAAFPLVVNALETGGEEAARAQLRSHASLLLLVGLPAAAGLMLLSQNVSGVLLGPSFRAAAVQIIPLIAFAGLLAGLKAYYFDLAFQLGRSTVRQLWISAIAASLNIVLNLLWIPRYGALGAAYSTILSFMVGITLSVWIGRSTFPMPVPIKQWAHIAIATAVMALALVPATGYRGPIALALQAAWGALVYGIMLLLLDVSGSRSRLARLVHR